jgi:serine/threonine-protein kinase RsbW
VYPAVVREGKTIEFFPSASDALDTIGEELHIPTRELMQLQDALDEIVSSAIKYSWPDGADAKVLVRITVQPEDLRLEIIDDGAPLDPRTAPEPPADRRPRPGGIGIYLIRKLVDGFAYQHSDAQPYQPGKEVHGRRQPDTGVNGGNQ